MCVPDWKKEHIERREESWRFFGNPSKFEREKHVVSRLLQVLCVDHLDSDLFEAAEPADVGFQNANFQVKEVMQPGRRRYDELREALEKAKKAERYSDLLEEYTPGKITTATIAEKSVARSKELLTKYGQHERNSLDLVCYFNYIDLHSQEVGCEVSFVEADAVPTVPFRALVPKGSRRLTVAGRNVSANRIAFAGIRAQCTCMAMGQAMGAAAALAVQRGVASRDVPAADIVALTVEHGAVPL